MTTYDITFSPETCRLIEAIENQSRRVRKAKIGNNEMEELIQFVSTIALKYEQISENINTKLAKKNKHKKTKRRRFSITKKDYYVIDRIIDSNKLNIYPRIIRIENKVSKRYDFYQIKRIARIFYVAQNKGISIVKRLLEVPDVHFVVSKIMQDEFGDLKRFLDYEA